MFGIMAYIPVCHMIDRPIYSLINLKRDVRDARHSQYYKLSEYIENFREGEEDELIDPIANLRFSEPADASAVSSEASRDELVVEPNQNRENSLFVGLKGKKVDATGNDDLDSRDATRVGTDIRNSSNAARFTKEFDLDKIEEESVKEQ